MMRVSPHLILLTSLLLLVLITGVSRAQDLPPVTPADSLIVPDTTVVAVTDTLPSPQPLDTLKVVRGQNTPVDHGIILSKSPTWAALRSTVLPGWGQAYTENYIKAIVFAGVDIGFIYGATVQHSRYLDALEDAENTKSDQERLVLERSANFYRDDRNRLLWYVAGVTLLSAVDAFVEAHLYDFHIDPLLETPPNNDGIQAGLSFTFSL